METYEDIFEEYVDDEPDQESEVIVEDHISII